MLGLGTGLAALLGAPAAAQQYGAPPPQQDEDQPTPAAHTLIGTSSAMSQGPAGQTETTYSFRQDGTFARVIPQPVDPNNPADGGAPCDGLQQEWLCAINNGHDIESAGCMMCALP